MDAREVCFLIGPSDSVLWADASMSPVAMSDSRARWEAIWANREQLVEIAHTHPMGGAHFSGTDERTMKALNEALGRQLIYSVVTPKKMLRRITSNDGTSVDVLMEAADHPWWTALIRMASVHLAPMPQNDGPPPGGHVNARKM